jgi:4-hydroxybenzoyl-CoA thioesterase
MLTNTRKIAIEWGDCDPLGIVFYPRYFAWFDACTAALFAHAGLPKHEMLKKYNILALPLVSTSAKFILPSKFGEEVTVESTVVEFRRSSFDVRHRVFNAGQLAIEASETRVWTGKDPENPNKFKGLPIPEEVTARFTGHPA